MASTLEMPRVSLTLPLEPQEASAAPAPDKLHVSWGGYEARCVQLAQQILDSGWEFDSIVGISRGGLMPAVLLSHLLRKKMGVICANSYEGEEEMQQGELSISNDIAIVANTLGTRVLFVDDLADKGETLIRMKEWMSKNHPEVTQLRTAVIWKKPTSQIEPDYYVATTTKWICQPFELKPLPGVSLGGKEL